LTKTGINKDKYISRKRFCQWKIEDKSLVREAASRLSTAFHNQNGFHNQQNKYRREGACPLSLCLRGSKPPLYDDFL
jgi:hypothetical protein